VGDDSTTQSQLTPSALGREARRRALAACDERDWYGVYTWTKTWVADGGGAWTVDAWLLYAISAVLHRQPRVAVRSLDLALGNWIEGREDRAVLRWTRATVVHHLLRDPKTARVDYDAALATAADWLRPQVEADITACVRDAAISRKRVASAQPAPEFEPPDARTFVARTPLREVPGAAPTVWRTLCEVLNVEPV
jgi:hypothetical protein